MSNKKYKLNLIGRDPEDNRDFQYHDVLASSPLAEGVSLPESWSWFETNAVEENQGSYGSCAAQTGACIQAVHNYRETGEYIPFSVSFIYTQRANYSEGTEGMLVRDLMKILHKSGGVFASDKPNERMNTLNTKELEAKAEKYRIESYHKIRTVEECKNAIFRNGPALIAVPVYNWGPEMWKKDSGEELEGGHAMTIIGWNDKGFIIRNSWGPKWNGDGTCVLKYDDWDLIWYAWTTVDRSDDPGFDPFFPDQEPVPTPKKPSWLADKTLQVLIAAALGIPLILLLVYALMR